MPWDNPTNVPFTGAIWSVAYQKQKEITHWIKQVTYAASQGLLVAMISHRSNTCQRISFLQKKRLKRGSSFNRVRVLRDTPLSGIGAARTAICVTKEIASRRDEIINIWRGYLNREWVEDQLDDPLALDVTLYLRLERSKSNNLYRLPITLTYCNLMIRPPIILLLVCHPMCISAYTTFI